MVNTIILERWYERHELTPSASQPGKPTSFNCPKAYTGSPDQQPIFKAKTCTVGSGEDLWAQRLGMNLAEIYLLLR